MPTTDFLFQVDTHSLTASRPGWRPSAAPDTTLSFAVGLTLAAARTRQQSASALVPTPASASSRRNASLDAQRPDTLARLLEHRLPRHGTGPARAANASTTTPTPGGPAPARRRASQPHPTTRHVELGSRRNRSPSTTRSRAAARDVARSPAVARARLVSRAVQNDQPDSSARRPRRSDVPANRSDRTEPVSGNASNGASPGRSDDSLESSAPASFLQALVVDASAGQPAASNLVESDRPAGATVSSADADAPLQSDAVVVLADWPTDTVFDAALPVGSFTDVQATGQTDGLQDGLRPVHSSLGSQFVRSVAHVEPTDGPSDESESLQPSGGGSAVADASPSETTGPDTETADQPSSVPASGPAASSGQQPVSVSAADGPPVPPNPLHVDARGETASPEPANDGGSASAPPPAVDGPPSEPRPPLAHANRAASGTPASERPGRSSSQPPPDAWASSPSSPRGSSANAVAGAGTSESTPEPPLGAAETKRPAAPVAEPAGASTPSAGELSPTPLVPADGDQPAASLTGLEGEPADSPPPGLTRGLSLSHALAPSQPATLQQQQPASRQTGRANNEPAAAAAAVPPLQEPRPAGDSATATRGLEPATGQPVEAAPPPAAAPSSELAAATRPHASEAASGSTAAVTPDEQPAETHVPAFPLDRPSPPGSSRTQAPAQPAEGLSNQLVRDGRAATPTDRSESPLGPSTAGPFEAAAPQRAHHAQPAQSQHVETGDAVRPSQTERLVGLVQQAAQGHQRLRVRLHPPELGTLQVEVTSHRGVLEVRLQVQSEAAQRALSEHLSTLRDALVQSGQPVERVHVQLVEPQSQPGGGSFGQASQWSGGWSGQETPGQSFGGPPQRPTQEPAQESRSERAVRAADQLDVRV